MRRYGGEFIPKTIQNERGNSPQRYARHRYGHGCRRSGIIDSSCKHLRQCPSYCRLQHFRRSAYNSLFRIHLVPRHPSPKSEKVLRIIDHSAIYLLIAGTYTPFTLVNLHGAWGWTLFGVVWGLALLGIVLQFSPLRKFSYVRLILYITMGWAAVAVIKPLAESVPRIALILIISGGLTYTVGIVFYLWRRLPYHHAIWHIFVLSGSILHYLAVLLSMNPSKG